ncbi:MAG: TasA family protein [Patescibacteria group bacterium]|jgi:predicted ribosomally synthesized peptide with SipW-like signal peptide
MKKIILSLSIILGVAVTAVSATISYFSDTETSQNNIVTTGTADIDVDGQNPWVENFSFGNMFPGESKEFNFNIRNVGSYPVRVWQILENVENSENGITGPEQQWYDANSVTEKNDIDSAMDFEMDVDGKMVVNKEAGFSVADVKDYYLNLVKLDQPFQPNNGDGILYPGGTISVSHKYYFNPAKAGNWAQSDQLTFNVRILAQQVETPEPLKLMSFIDNKYNSNSWISTRDNILGLLKYESAGDNFDYRLVGNNLPAGTYKLVYYPDPWASPKTVFLLSDGLNSDGSILDSGNISFNIGIDLPNIGDDNYGHGAKVWLVPTSALAGNNLGWSPNNNQWLFDNWPGLINYKKGDKPSSPASESIKIDEVLSTTDWTSEARDYSLANVNFSYDTPATSRLSGTVTATGLKPYTTYQVKFIGKPTCAYSGGDDTANEYIGYKGRWTVLNSSCSGDACNRTDAAYEANKSSHAECIAGYLVWDFFTTDGSGNATKNVLTDCSYHVLWCNGGACGAADNSQLKYQPEAGLNYHYCDAGDVEGEIERGTCGGLILDNGDYDLNLVLTEESFHQPEGVWATVLQKDINFTIN